jgi:hypothetical protein
MVTKPFQTRTKMDVAAKQRALWLFPFALFRCNFRRSTGVNDGKTGLKGAR